MEQRPKRIYQVFENFYAGVYPADLNPREERRKIKYLLEQGVTVFINLTEKGERNYFGEALRSYRPSVIRLSREMGMDGKGFYFLRFPIKDGGVPTVRTMRAVLAVIGRHLEEGRKIYLHCWGGRGRTGTVLGCWLTEKMFKDGAEALKWMEKKFEAYEISRPYPEHEQQRQYILNWTPAKSVGNLE